MTLVDQFRNYFGIRNVALKWVKSYFHGRTQSVVIGDITSQPVALNQGVPQGSVIGPRAYTMYTRPLGDIINTHNLQYHIYADDVQIYMPLLSDTDVNKQLVRIENCVKDVQHWMTKNKLKLNSGKTELLHISRPC